MYMCKKKKIICVKSEMIKRKFYLLFKIFNKIFKLPYPKDWAYTAYGPSGFRRFYSKIISLKSKLKASLSLLCCFLAKLEVNFPLIGRGRRGMGWQAETQPDPSRRGSSTVYSSHTEPDFIALIKRPLG